MATSSEPALPPQISSAPNKAGPLSARAISHSDIDHGTAIANTMARLPKRAISAPAGSMATNDPSPLPSRARPSAAAPSPRCSWADGTRDSHVPLAKPCSRKTIETLNRAG